MIAAAPNVVESADWELHGRGQLTDAAIRAVARLLVDLDRKRRNGEIKAPQRCVKARVEVGDAETDGA